jgi:hypothetical protein
VMEGESAERPLPLHPFALQLEKVLWFLANNGKLFAIISAKGGHMAKTEKKDIVQVKNPKTDRYVKIDRDAGRIIDHKKSEGPYKGIPIARKRNK